MAKRLERYGARIIAQKLREEGCISSSGMDVTADAVRSEVKLNYPSDKPRKFHDVMAWLRDRWSVGSKWDLTPDTGQETNDELDGPVRS